MLQDKQFNIEIDHGKDLTGLTPAQAIMCIKYKNL